MKGTCLSCCSGQTKISLNPFIAYGKAYEEEQLVARICSVSTSLFQRHSFLFRLSSEMKSLENKCHMCTNTFLEKTISSFLEKNINFCKA